MFDILDTYNFILCTKILATNDEQSRILKIEIRMKGQLETEVNQLNKEIAKLNDSIIDMDKERDRFV